MGQFTTDPNSIDEDGHVDNNYDVHTDTVHTQINDPEPDFIGSSSLRRRNPNGTMTNAPSNFDRVTPDGAKVDSKGVTRL